MKELPVNVWIENDGKTRPNDDAIVEVEYIDGDIESPFHAYMYDFSYRGDAGEIKRFKILDPQQAIVEESEKLGLYDSATLTTVINKMRKREQVGRGKYGTDVDRKDFTAKEWANHAHEEAMDFVLYMQRLIDEMPDAE